MRNFRWWIRIYFLALLFVGLGAYLLSTTSWRSWLGMNPTYAAEIADGDTIVSAIYAYKTARGLWPEYLDDLSPEFLPATKVPAATWHYEVTPGQLTPGIPTGSVPLPHRAHMLTLSMLALHEGIAHIHLGYDFDPAAPAWRIFGNTEPRLLRSGRPAGARVPPAFSEAVARSGLAEVERRLKREPLNVEHWRTKASLLLAIDQIPEAVEVVEAAEKQMPATAWPAFAAAYLEIRRHADDPGLQMAAFERFGAWAKKHTAMTHDYYAFRLAETLSRDDLAVVAIAAAIKRPIEVQSDDTEIAAFYLYDMARDALGHDHFDLVIAVAGAWEAAQPDALTREESFLPLRAAARLASGDAAGAKKDLDAIKSPAAKMWAQNVESLRAAVLRSDKSFRYRPGTAPPSYEPFEIPD